MAGCSQLINGITFNKCHCILPFRTTTTTKMVRDDGQKRWKMIYFRLEYRTSQQFYLFFVNWSNQFLQRIFSSKMCMKYMKETTTTIVVQFFQGIENFAQKMGQEWNKAIVPVDSIQTMIMAFKSTECGREEKKKKKKNGKSRANTKWVHMEMLFFYSHSSMHIHTHGEWESLFYAEKKLTWNGYLESERKMTNTFRMKSERQK